MYDQMLTRVCSRLDLLLSAFVHVVKYSRVKFVSKIINIKMRSVS